MHHTSNVGEYAGKVHAIGGRPIGSHPDHLGTVPVEIYQWATRISLETALCSILSVALV